MDEMRKKPLIWSCGKFARSFKRTAERKTKKQLTI